MVVSYQFIPGVRDLDLSVSPLVTAALRPKSCVQAADDRLRFVVMTFHPCLLQPGSLQHKIAGSVADPTMLSITLAAHAFVAAPATTLARDAASPRMTAHWMDHLKFGGTTPDFDVVEKTKEYVAATEENRGVATDYHADDYVFRGSIIGLYPNPNPNPALALTQTLPLLPAPTPKP